MLVANTAARVGRARARFFLDDGSMRQTVTDVGPASRTNRAVPPMAGDVFPLGFSVVVESLRIDEAGPVPLVVERAMYYDVGGIEWKAGTATPGTPLGPQP